MVDATQDGACLLMPPTVLAVVRLVAVGQVLGKKTYVMPSTARHLPNIGRCLLPG